jgi:hypothetical protein
MIGTIRLSTQRVFTFVALFAALFGPAIVARSQSPLVYMTMDSTLNRFDNGIQTFAVGSGSFSGVTQLGANLLVADYTGDRIQRFTPTGAALSPFAFFESPTFLESDNAGNVYATQVPFTSVPAVITRFNSAGGITGSFAVPNAISLNGIDADAAGNMYVVDATNSFLHKFDPSGVLLNSIPYPSTDDDIAIDEVGKRLYSAASASGLSFIAIYDISGAIPVFTGTFGPFNSDLVGISFAPDSGNILAADFGARNPPPDMPRGYEFSPSGSLLRTYVPTSGDFAFDILAYQIPEPSTVLGLAIGLVGMVCGRRR